MKNPTVSVIIPTYNRAHLVARAIQSVLNQTYKDFELIIVDDGSTDNTEDIIKEFQKKDERIKYIKHDKNRGGSAARNTGIKAARGNFIAFLDSDDEYLSYKLEKNVNILKNANSNVSIVYSNILIIDNKIKFKGIKKGISGNIYNNILLTNFIHLNSVLVKRECFLKELFDERFPRHQEWDLWIRLAKKYKFTYIDDVLAIWYRDCSCNRVSDHIENTIIANKLFLKKYYNDLKNYPKFRSLRMREIANAYCQLGNTKKGNNYFKLSLKCYPFNIKSIIGLILSFGGIIKRYM